MPSVEKEAKKGAKPASVVSELELIVPSEKEELKGAEEESKGAKEELKKKLRS